MKELQEAAFYCAQRGASTYDLLRPVQSGMLKWAVWTSSQGSMVHAMAAEHLQGL